MAVNDKLHIPTAVKITEIHIEAVNMMKEGLLADDPVLELVIKYLDGFKERVATLATPEKTE